MTATRAVQTRKEAPTVNKLYSIWVSYTIYICHTITSTLIGLHTEPYALRLRLRLRSEADLAFSENSSADLQYGHELEHKLLQHDNIGEDVVQTGRPHIAAFRLLVVIEANLLHEHIGRRRRLWWRWLENRACLLWCGRL